MAQRDSAEDSSAVLAVTEDIGSKIRIQVIIKFMVKL